MHKRYAVVMAIVLTVAFAGAAFAAGQPAQQELRDQAFLSSLAQPSAPQACPAVAAGPMGATPLVNCTNSFCENTQNCAICPGGLSAWFCNSNHRCQPF